MPFYTYTQNNSGGRFDTKVPYILIVEAPSARVANTIAEDHGAYFNGVESGRDCSCCGDRWCEPWGSSERPFDECYFDTNAEREAATAEVRREDGARTKVVYLDGRVTYHDASEYLGRRWMIAESRA